MTRTNIRRGGIAVWALVVLPVVLLLVMLALAHVHTSLALEHANRTADIAALSAAEELVCDDLLVARLRGDGSHLGPTFDRSHAAAVRACSVNPILGQIITPDRNPDNSPEGDFVVGGVRRHGFSCDFIPARPNQYAGVNAVRICLCRDGVPAPGGFRLDVCAIATAMLDGEVCGFEINCHGQRIPLAPLALDRRVWEAGLDGRSSGNQGDDDGKDSDDDDDQDDRRKDGDIRLPEIVFRMMAGPTGKGNGNGRRPTAVPLTIGTRSVAELASQFVAGVTEEQYFRFVDDFGPFELDEHGEKLGVPADRFYGKGNHEALRAALTALKQSGEVRAYPTSVRFSLRHANMVEVSGFVAARVVDVRESVADPKEPKGKGADKKDHPDPSGPPRSLLVTLRPAMLCTPTAVTRHGAPINLYVCRIQLTR
jgi:hypothetical protein